MTGDTSPKGSRLIELAVTALILVGLSAIAVPQMSPGASASADAALVADLSVLRSAIDLYRSEHNGVYPRLASFEDQLTRNTDDKGLVGPKSGNFIYGPYLRKIPPLPAGKRHRGQAAVAAPCAPDALDAGWLYDDCTGRILPNTGPELDARGIPFNTY